MPIYSYKCVDCNLKQDKDHGMSDNPEVLCQECKKPCIKIPGLGAVKFNGSGWGKDAR